MGLLLSANRDLLVLVVQFVLVVVILIPGGNIISAAPLAADPIPGYLSQVSLTSLSDVATTLVTQMDHGGEIRTVPILTRSAPLAQRCIPKAR